MKLKISVCSWNIGGASAIREDAIWDRIVSDEPDLLVIGLQELPIGSSLGPFVQESPSMSGRCSSVTAAVNRALPPSFVLLKHVEFGLNSIDVFARGDVAIGISRIETTSLGLGWANVLSNKGVVAIRMLVEGHWICFANCHLQPHCRPRDRQRRQAQMQEIIDGVTGGHDHLLWCGDFNFRLHMGSHEAMQCIQERQWRTLVEDGDRPSSLDELQEGKIAFAPTFKFRLHRSGEIPEYNLKRVPAYCDRIFYRGVGGECVTYDSLPQSTSDHQPVLGVYVLQLGSKRSGAPQQPIPWGKPSLFIAVGHSFLRMPLAWKAGIILCISLFCLYFASFVFDTAE